MVCLLVKWLETEVNVLTEYFIFVDFGQYSSSGFGRPSSQFLLDR
jgi:hypothetical protein